MTPSPPDEGQLRLFVLPPSHFCERARWALDHAGIPYTEERWAVGLHAVLARRLRASGTTLPLLDTGRGLIQGSDRILDWSGTPGGDPGLEHRFERRIGPLVRQYLYSTALADPRSGVRDLLLDGVPERQARMGRLAWPLTRRLMMAGMNARPGLLPKLAVDLAAEIDWFKGELGDRTYLVGDQLGRADITAASLLAPLARPPELPLYRRTKFSAEVEATIAQWRARPALRWVERIYAQHRR